MINEKCIPFVKWFGGKRRLINEISKYYPFYKEQFVNYVEPFVGGGAVLFDLLNNYKLEKVYINDLNYDLINVYKQIQSNVKEVIEYLQQLDVEYFDYNNQSSHNHRKNYYLCLRDIYNNDSELKRNKAKHAAITIFLNKTCFNGMFRVNKNGKFNSSFGYRTNNEIYNEHNLYNISKNLKNVSIHCGSYLDMKQYIDNRTFVYIDPPYRPISTTEGFTSYTNVSFNDSDQIELANFIYDINKIGAKFVLSNSDPKNIDVNDNFFDELYKDYTIERVQISRNVAGDKSKRKIINEILVHN